MLLGILFPFLSNDRPAPTVLQEASGMTRQTAAQAGGLASGLPKDTTKSPSRTVWYLGGPSHQPLLHSSNMPVCIPCPSRHFCPSEPSYSHHPHNTYLHTFVSSFRRLLPQCTEMIL